MMLRFVLLCFGLFSLVSCATEAPNRMLVGTVRSPTSPSRVRVYDYPPKRFERIALVQGKTIFDLRIEAAKVGANGVLVSGVAYRPGPTIGFGLGTSHVEYGRHGAFGYGTSVSYETPLGENQVLQGTAIYAR